MRNTIQRNPQGVIDKANNHCKLKKLHGLVFYPTRIKRLEQNGLVHRKCTWVIKLSFDSDVFA